MAKASKKAPVKVVKKTTAKKTATKKTAPVKKAADGSNADKIDEYLAKKNNPMTAEIQRVREIILGVSDKIEEDIKWSVPTFMYRGNIASFFMNAKQHVSLMFHYGASIPDKAGLLEGDGQVGRVAKFTDMKDVEKKKAALQAIIKEWIKMKDAE
ncbi:MAG TPA: DUF1801 domain-containing protein [Flavipsychrobacter sp.]|nr:DUF1801 domain-containing protein [Flavipsychrobacter sp.]